jgi:hypothetical protein
VVPDADVSKSLLPKEGLGPLYPCEPIFGNLFPLRYP